jgi:CO/xanthine dehydrogenase FAD-binding subunit
MIHDASEQAEEFAKERSVPEFFDEVAIPALIRAQADCDRDVLSAQQRAEIRETVAAMLENLGDNAIEEAGPTADDGIRGMTAGIPTICCIAGRNALDMAAALLLAHLLRLGGRVGTVQVLSADVLVSDTAYPSAFADATLICLSLISTTAPIRVRYLVRRVRRRAPHAKVLVGIWGLSSEEVAAARAATGSSADIVTTLRDAAAKLLNSSTNLDFPASVQLAGAEKATPSAD